MEIIKLKKEVGQRPRVQSLLRVPGGFLAVENGEARSSGGRRASLSGGRARALPSQHSAPGAFPVQGPLGLKRPAQQLPWQ